MRKLIWWCCVRHLSLGIYWMSFPSWENKICLLCTRSSTGESFYYQCCFYSLQKKLLLKRVREADRDTEIQCSVETGDCFSRAGHRRVKTSGLASDSRAKFRFILIFQCPHCSPVCLCSNAGRGKIKDQTKGFILKLTRKWHPAL